MASGEILQMSSKKAKEASGIGLVRKFILELQEEEEEVITYKIL